MSAVHPLVVQLRRERKQRGLTQRHLADLLSVSRMTLQAWELGYRQPSLDRLEEWAGVLGRTITSREPARVRRDEHDARVELLQTERVHHVPARMPAADKPLKPVTPAGARRNREVLAAALGHEDDYVPRGTLWMPCDHSLPAGGAP